jgi:hypothetical protein
MWYVWKLPQPSLKKLLEDFRMSYKVLEGFKLYMRILLAVKISFVDSLVIKAIKYELQPGYII